MPLSNRLRFKIFMRDDFTCKYCGRRAPATQLHVDHRTPRAAGGSDDETNLVTACVECNSGKSATLIPATVTLADGPLNGQTIRTTELYPFVWVWLDVDGLPIPLLDALVENTKGSKNYRKARHGPSWVVRPSEEYAVIAPRLRMRESDGAHGVLAGAYVPSDHYPFDTFAELTWQEPWMLLLDFEFTDAR